MNEHSIYRVLPGTQGQVWLRQGWALFRRDMGSWTAIVILWWLLDAVCGAIPLLGNVTMLLDPVLAAGLVIGCNQLRQGKRLDITCLFAGFERAFFGPLLVLGIINLVVDLTGNLLAMGAAMVFGAGALVRSLQDFNVNVDVNDLGQLQGVANQLSGKAMHLMQNLGPLLLSALPGLYAAIVVKFLLACALAIVFYFAPALIVLSRQDAWAAIRHSWQATADNWLSITMYGLWFVGAVTLAMLPALLACAAAYLFGAVWLALALPLLLMTLLVLIVPATVVGVAGAYLAYRDIFADLPSDPAMTRGLDAPARQH